MSLKRYGIIVELFNMLINPLEHDFALRWHRDDVKETATAEEEEKALGIWNHGVRTLFWSRRTSASAHS